LRDSGDDASDLSEISFPDSPATVFHADRCRSSDKPNIALDWCTCGYWQRLCTLRCTLPMIITPRMHQTVANTGVVPI
jgi:hypothetical protein